MTQLYFKSENAEIKEVQLDDGETVLNGLLRNGVDVPYGCRTGVCQSCLMQSTDKDVPRGAQKGLREVQKQQGYFLSCCCQPKAPMVVSLSGLFKKEATEVLETTPLSDQVVRIRLRKVICYRSGQYATLWKDAEVARTYSLVSHPTADNFLEFHIRVYPGGVFSDWAKTDLKVGDKLEIQGPMGECYYHAKDRQQTLFLAGLGTGLAPLYGVVRDALIRGHQGRILLLSGARTHEGLYYQKELAMLQQQFSNLEVRFSVQDIPPDLRSVSGRASDIYAMAKMLMPDFTESKVFLAGGESFVRKMKKQCFLAGANMGDIAADTFLSFPK